MGDFKDIIFNPQPNLKNQITKYDLKLSIFSVPSRPHAFHKFSKCPGDLSFHAKRIFFVDVLDVVVVGEVLHDWWSVGQALASKTFF